MMWMQLPPVAMPRTLRFADATELTSIAAPTPDGGTGRSQSTPTQPVNASADPAPHSDSMNSDGSDTQQLEAAVEATSQNYAMSRVTLRFEDPDVERAYVDFATSANSFGPGKVYVFLAAAINGLVFLVFRAGGPHPSQFTEAYWAALWINVVVTFGLFGLLFVDALVKFREALFLLVLAFHWPAFTAVALHEKHPKSFAYSYCVACFAFCTFIAQPRFVGIFVFLVITPVATFAGTTFGDPSYWPDHTKAEMVFWIHPLFPLILLRVFEHRSRTAFVENRQSSACVEVMERRTEMTRKLIAHFFPQTATMRLLATHGEEQYSVYQHTVLLVTDIASFSEYSVLTDLELLVTQISATFAAIDQHAGKFGVEKIATVGDSYFGAIFASSVATSHRERIGANCHAMLCFATAVAKTKRVLPGRIGVHIGHVLGGFVGIEPPKFDLFGRAVAAVLALQQTGQPRRIHASREVIATAGELGSASRAQETSAGIIMERWASYTDWSNEVDEAVVLARCEIQTRALDICRVVASFGERQRSLALEGFESRDATLRRNLVRAAAAGQGMSAGSEEDTAPLNAPEAATAREDQYFIESIDEPGDENLLYNFSPYKLMFDDPAVEKRYITTLLTSDLARDAHTILAAQLAFAFASHVVLGCFHTLGNRLLVATIAMLIVFFVLYLYWVGTSHGWNIVPVIATWFTIAASSTLVYEDGCNSAPQQAYYSGTFLMLYWVLCALVPNFSLEIRMMYRHAILVVNCSFVVAAIGYRKAVLADDTFHWDWIPLVLLAAFAFVSYFADFALRSGFQATLRKRALRSNRSRHAAVATSALDMMLPSFVIDRLVNSSKARDDMSDTGSQFSVESLSVASNTSGSSNGSGRSSRSRGRPLFSETAAHAMLTRQCETVWKYRAAVVMFVSFEPPVFAYDAVSDTITRIESVARWRSIQKVKTIGSTVLCVAGIDKTLSTEDAAVNMIEAALEIKRRVFPETLTGSWTFRIAISVGPVLGAVIGSKGLAFDIYGGTVNDAKNLLATAPPRTVVCTSATKTTIPVDAVELDFSFTSATHAVQAFEIYEKLAPSANHEAVHSPASEV